MSDGPAISVLLQEARAARHDLMTGKAIASARDQNGEEVRYTKAEATALSAYIAELETLVAAAAGTSHAPLGPMRVFF